MSIVCDTPGSVEVGDGPGLAGHHVLVIHVNQGTLLAAGKLSDGWIGVDLLGGVDGPW